MTKTSPNDRKTSKPVKPKPGVYRRQHDANSVTLYMRRMRKALDEPGTPRWMLYASSYDRHLVG